MIAINRELEIFGQQDGDDTMGASSVSANATSIHVTANRVYISGVHWNLVDDRAISPGKPVVFIAGVTETLLKLSLQYQTPSGKPQESSSGASSAHQQRPDVFLMSGKLAQVLYVRHLNSAFNSVSLNGSSTTSSDCNVTGDVAED